MDVKTGAILGMTSKPDFDLNSPNKISNKVLAESISAISSPDEQKKMCIRDRIIYNASH